MGGLKATPNTTCCDLYSTAGIHHQRLLERLCLGAVHVPVVIRITAVVCSRADYLQGTFQNPLWTVCAGKGRGGSPATPGIETWHQQGSGFLYVLALMVIHSVLVATPP